MFKKLLVIFFIFIPFGAIAIEKETNFTLETFNEARKTGKTIVINSWNKFCGTCVKQIKILKQAKKDFPEVVFLSYEQTKNKQIADLLNVQYWATILVFKNGKEVVRELGLADKKKIYSIINQ